MDGDDDDGYDFLLDLLSYECPISGKQRIAGAASDEPPQFLSFQNIVDV